MEPQASIQIHIPPSLRHLAIPLSTFLAQNKQYTNLVVSSFIFAPSSPSSSSSPSTTPTTTTTPNPRLLIVQRAATERSFPNRWEVPGGGCEVGDPTILHSLAREAFEETGLRLTRVCRQIGSGLEFVTGYGVRQKRWCKLSFEIEVAQEQADATSAGRLGGQDKMAPTENDAVDEAAENEGMTGMSVTLDPAEHQAYTWALESEIAEDTYALMNAEQKDLMLKAFALRRAEPT